jgi:hypothetical protein
LDKKEEQIIPELKVLSDEVLRQEAGRRIKQILLYDETID